MADRLCRGVESPRLPRFCHVSECGKKSTLDKGSVGGGRYSTIKWRHSVGRGVYESGAFVLNLSLDEMIQEAPGWLSH